MPFIAIYDWSMFTLPAGLPFANIEGDTHANAPDAPDYQSANPTWIGETFTFNGGTPTQIDITDDDGVFEDGYVETGAAQTLTSDVTINGTLYTAGSVVQNEFSMVDAAGNQVFVVAINGVNVGFTYALGDAPSTGQTFTPAHGLDGDPADSSAGYGSSSQSYNGIVCYASGTLIRTPQGDRPVETLRVGDAVMTLDRGAQIIRWVGAKTLTGNQLRDADKPIRFGVDALGPGQPTLPLAVSPNHRILLPAPMLRGHVAERGVLAPAKALLALPRVRRMRGKRRVTYHHVLLDRHGILIANGVAAESFYPGVMALHMLPDAECADLMRTVARLVQNPGRGYGPLAREALSVRDCEARLRTNGWRRHAVAKRKRAP
ncbi:Hint domain-containing protein [Thalassococcus sp. CAU 1522]|uniref:Hint domain-containing protein n=1 Tax=Thalassococcus arenae TaxID=2851652 RepID=A0ABS6N733_9RHOB|nr:Hint domain-containing protein [Thalassococcus arenae]MBV2359826.1 Hint domain-containing protein [Thalassococcus arenae]